MYLRILKKDLKRKKTMNIILLIFIILAATFIASSANNMTAVITALDSYLDMADVPDQMFATFNKDEIMQYETFAAENDYNYQNTTYYQIGSGDVLVDGKNLSYSSSILISSPEGYINTFDSAEQKITQVNDGEIYIPSEIFYSTDNNIKVGDEIKLTIGEKTKSFILKSYMKDAIFGTSMLSMSHFLISENDYKDFKGQQVVQVYISSTYTDDSDYNQKFIELGLNTLFSADRTLIKTMYFMDILIAAVMLIVSICLILISIVILRFTINFTMSEEYREIGVMKALGLKPSKIRGLYIIKYLAISIIGAAIGLLLSIPFSQMLLKDISRNIILSMNNNILLNALCALATAGFVVLFSYFCTRKIKNFSPIDAIRNGQRGERFSRKSIVGLKSSKLSPVFFLAINDILCDIKRFVSMIIIFVLGLLLIILPINTINTLQSDKIITWFSMGDCNHVVVSDILFRSVNKAMFEDDIHKVKDHLAKNDIDANVFQEIMFRMTISRNDKKTTSLAYQGLGDITTADYTYLEGTPPQNKNEIAITVIIADSIDAKIGDEVKIKDGDQIKSYVITSIYQSLNNMGEGIRFHPDEDLDYHYAAGCFNIQVKYNDNPNHKTLEERKTLLEKAYPEAEINTASEYVNDMIGDITTQLDSVKTLILIIVLCINILVTVLMVKSFITKEKGEIAMLKAVGFKSSALVAWQTIRIGIVLLLSIVIATLLSTPLSKLAITPAFQVMGTQSIEFNIVPLEVYVIYPLIVLCVTVTFSMLAALQVKKINTSETSNIE